ncbi:MAG: FAD-dependent oxidoreductase [Candidatus Nanopelagicales bacterium]|nr:FAD-dependent oxidoreductase [Candidatus Nanopelagicales bacterium]
MFTVQGPTQRVVVVGAGLAGLSAAMRLAGAGREVVVLEREDRPGGRAGRLEMQGYSFDTGPTVLTMPDLIDDAFRALGEDYTDWLDLVPLDPAYRAFYPDASSTRTRPRWTSTPTPNVWLRRSRPTSVPMRLRATGASSTMWPRCTGWRSGTSSTGTSTAPWTS